jgi:hypothetical protein
MTEDIVIDFLFEFRRRARVGFLSCARVGFLEAPGLDFEAATNSATKKIFQYRPTLRQKNPQCGQLLFCYTSRLDFCFAIKPDFLVAPELDFCFAPDFIYFFAKIGFLRHIIQ